MNRIILLVSFIAFSVLSTVMLIKSYTPPIREMLSKHRSKGIFALIIFLLIMGGLLFLFFYILRYAP